MGKIASGKTPVFAPVDRPLAYVCTDRACAPPVYHPSRMEPTLRGFARQAYSLRP